MNVVAVKVDEDNKVDITLEELNKILNDAYNEGYKKGQENTRLYIPSTAKSTSPISPYWTCGSDVELCRKTNVDDDLSINGTHSNPNSNIKAKI